jgi:hypothetical protein
MANSSQNNFSSYFTETSPTIFYRYQDTTLTATIANSRQFNSKSLLLRKKYPIKNKETGLLEKDREQVLVIPRSAARNLLNILEKYVVELEDSVQEPVPVKVENAESSEHPLSGDNVDGIGELLSSGARIAGNALLAAWTGSGFGASEDPTGSASTITSSGANKQQKQLSDSAESREAVHLNGGAGAEAKAPTKEGRPKRTYFKPLADRTNDGKRGRLVQHVRSAGDESDNSDTRDAA